MKQPPVLFLTLRLFSATGGIEKVCRMVSQALHERSLEQDAPYHVSALHDHRADAQNNTYLPESDFSGHQNKLRSFIFHCLRKLRRPSTIVLSHVNLLPVGVLLKCWSPRSKLVLFAHGIELWDYPGRLNRMLLGRVDFFWAVSGFTAQRIQEQYRIPSHRCQVLNNALDPALSVPLTLPDKRTARSKLGLPANTPILFMLARLQSSERYKGYDQVIRAMAMLKTTYPELIYCIGGKYDEQEKNSIEELAQHLGLEKQVRLLGFVSDEALADWYRAADVYVMPSWREGFGLVFIEAMRYGLPVIAGNRDGSVDALLQGQLGQLVDPFDENAIAHAIDRVLQTPEFFVPEQTLLLNHFGYGSYREKLDFCLKFVQGKHA
jgi:glycosyltransferase involved in cell wall biosynthesis